MSGARKNMHLGASGSKAKTALNLRKKSDGQVKTQSILSHSPGFFGRKLKLFRGK